MWLRDKVSQTYVRAPKGLCHTECPYAARDGMTIDMGKLSITEREKQMKLV